MYIMLAGAGINQDAFRLRGVWWPVLGADAKTCPRPIASHARGTEPEWIAPAARPGQAANGGPLQPSPSADGCVIKASLAWPCAINGATEPAYHPAAA
jgi:hypothetical protein